MAGLSTQAQEAAPRGTLIARMVPSHSRKPQTPERHRNSSASSTITGRCQRKIPYDHLPTASSGRDASTRLIGDDIGPVAATTSRITARAVAETNRT